MKKLFLTVINILSKSGEITSATMFKDGNFSTIHLKCGKDNYSVTIMKEIGYANDND